MDSIWLGHGRAGHDHAHRLRHARRRRPSLEHLERQRPRAAVIPRVPVAGWCSVDPWLAKPALHHHRIPMAAALKIVVEKHSDGYVAYPLGLSRGTVVGQGETYDEALADVRSALAFHVETFGPESLAQAQDDPILE